MKRDKLDEIFCEDNLYVLQLIVSWENRTDGNPIPEAELEAALQKAGFEWDLIRMYSSITQLLMMQMIRLIQQGDQTHYQTNQDIMNWLLDIAHGEKK